MGRRSRKLADEALREGALAVSAVSFWEVAMLIAKRRISIELPLASWRLDLVRAGLVEVALDGSTGTAAAELEYVHADPADRIILATALAAGATLLTADKRMLAWSGGFDRRDARL